MSPAEIKKATLEWMRSNVHENLRPGSNWRVDRTDLVVNCANALGHPEWLDEPSHSIWETADEVADWHEQINPQQGE